MSKAVLYGLVLGLTYATLDKGVFHAGQAYTAAQVGDHLDDATDEGENYFAEIGEDDEVVEVVQSGEVKVTKKSVTINKKATAATTVESPAPVEPAKVGGVDPDTMTV